jgi:two-component system sensor histidine kinase QseC
MRRLQRWTSLRARLVVLLLGVVTVVWLGAALLTWYGARHELDELLDGHLAQAASLLIVQQARVHHDDDDDESPADAPSLHKYAPMVAFQVFQGDRLVMHSSNAGTAAMATLTSGFVTVDKPDGVQWRVFATRGDQLVRPDIQVYVGEQTASRGQILKAVLKNVLLPLFFALPLLALAALWAVRQGLLPLQQLGDTLRQRQPQAMDPIRLADLPDEMQPMVAALNALLEKIQAMVESERRFTADAAHELRTPIAAIRAQAQVAMGAGADSAQLAHALAYTLAGCDRATRLIEQLLTLARLDVAAVAPNIKTDLCAVLRDVAAELAPGALAHGQTLDLDAAGECPVFGEEALLGVLARNLIDNAIRYSPAGARVRVIVSRGDDGVILSVEDSGPGMSAQDAARLGERFYRVLGNSKPGSGLGWSIVQRIAVVLGAQLLVGVSDALGGLKVTVRWPDKSAQALGNV